MNVLDKRTGYYLLSAYVLFTVVAFIAFWLVIISQEGKQPIVNIVFASIIFSMYFLLIGGTLTRHGSNSFILGVGLLFPTAKLFDASIELFIPVAGMIAIYLIHSLFRILFIPSGSGRYIYHPPSGQVIDSHNSFCWGRNLVSFSPSRINEKLDLNINMSNGKTFLRTLNLVIKSPELEDYQEYIHYWYRKYGGVPIYIDHWWDTYGRGVILKKIETMISSHPDFDSLSGAEQMDLIRSSVEKSNEPFSYQVLIVD